MRIRWVLGIAAILCVPAWSADASWRMATTPNYRILSQLSDSDTADWMRGFDQFVLSTTGALGLNPRALTPLTVVIFAHDQDYSPFKPARPNGKTANVAGQFVWRQSWSMIAMAHDSFDAQSRRTIYHEATHWLMSVDQTRHPAWFNEGIAEMFSTFERNVTKVEWGKPIDEHLVLLRDAALMPLSQLLVEPSALFDRDDRTGMFYAQSWAFTHFLMFSKDQSRRKMLAKFLETYKTSSGEATVKAVFGDDLPALEKEFHVYVAQRTWLYMNEPVKPAPPPLALQPASPELVQASLGFLALGSERPELARQYAQKAIELDPSAPEGHALLAYLNPTATGFEGDAVVQEAEAAVQRDSHDAEMFRILGDSYVSGSNKGKPNAARASVTLYEKAINASPHQVAYFDRLADALYSLEKPTEDDAKFLSVGLKLFPGDEWLHIGNALANDRLGHRDVAVVELETVLRPDSRLDAGQRDFADGLHRRWLVEGMNSEIQPLMDQRRFAEARAVVSRYRERLGSSSQSEELLSATDNRLAIMDGIDRYDELIRTGKKAEAAALARQLLAAPDVPDAIRQHLQGSQRKK